VVEGCDAVDVCSYPVSLQLKARDEPVRCDSPSSSVLVCVRKVEKSERGLDQATFFGSATISHVLYGKGRERVELGEHLTCFYSPI
jgi:hypothetical protein